MPAGFMPAQSATKSVPHYPMRVSGPLLHPAYTQQPAQQHRSINHPRGRGESPETHALTQKGVHCKISTIHSILQSSTRKLPWLRQSATICTVQCNPYGTDSPESAGTGRLRQRRWLACKTLLHP